MEEWEGRRRWKASREGGRKEGSENSRGLGKEAGREAGREGGRTCCGCHCCLCM